VACSIIGSALNGPHRPPALLRSTPKRTNRGNGSTTAESARGDEGKGLSLTRSSEPDCVLTCRASEPVDGDPALKRTGSASEMLMMIEQPASRRDHEPWNNGRLIGQ